MENNYRPPKRPRNWAKPYWNKAGNLFIAFLASVGVGFVGSFLRLPLYAIVQVSPLWERVMGLGISLLCSGGAAVFFGYQEGYNRRRFSLRTALLGGALYLLIHAVPTLLSGGSALVCGYVATDLASIFFYGNVAYAVDPLPPLLVLACAAAVDALVYIPLTTLGDWWGAHIYASDVQELQEDHEKRKDGFPA